MAYFTHDGSGNRTVEAKMDIGDYITRLGITSHPLIAALSSKSTSDTNPKTVEDSLSSIDTSNAFAQGAAAPAASDTARTLNDNQVQVFLKTAEVSDVQNAIAQYGLGKELEYQELKKAIEIMRDGEAILVSDQAVQEPTAANNRIGKMKGMTTIISSNTDAIGDWSLTNMQTLQAAIVAAGGSNVTECWMDSTRKIAVDGWTTTPTRFTTAIKELEKEVILVHTSFGGAAMHWHPYVPQDVASDGANVLMLDYSLWEIRTLLPLFRKTLPDNGGGPSTLIKWGWTLLCKAEAGNAAFE